MDSQLKVSRAVSWLGNKIGFFGSCLMQLGTAPEEMQGAHAATDGITVFYNPSSIDKMSEAQVRYTLCHEVEHVLLNHVEVLDENQRDKWDLKVVNIATDWVIFFELRKLITHYGRDKLDEPEGILSDPTGKTNNWHWQQIYKMLMNIKEDKPPTEGMSFKPKEEPRFDESEIEAIKKQITDDQNNDHLKPGKGNQSPSEIKKRKDYVNDVIVRATEASKSSPGSMPSHIRETLKDIRESVVPWETLIKNAVMAKYPEDYSYRRPSRKRSDVIFPSMVGTKAGTICIGVDSSGSVMSKELSAGYSEVVHIINNLKPEKVYVMTCDCSEPIVKEFPEGHFFEVKDFMIEGGGGTSFLPVFNYIEENNIFPDQLIYFSDMMVFRSDVPKEAPNYDVTWMSYRKDGYVPSFGEYIEIKV